MSEGTATLAGTVTGTGGDAGAERTRARASADGTTPWSVRVRATAVEFWLRALMRAARDAPRLTAAMRGPLVWGTWWCSPAIRKGTLANAGRLLGPCAAGPARRALARRVVGSFYDFVGDMGRNRRLSADGLAGLVGAIEGNEHFVGALAMGRGVVIVTAHLGAFETAVAALRGRAERVHVVFKRDEFPVFEAMRSEQRRRLGVIEAPVDEGWPMWLRLRNALRRNEVVLMQGDRLLPGQSGVRVRFCDGHIELPTGPAKLAAAAGSPILPVFAIRGAEGLITLVVDEPIMPDPAAGVEGFGTVMERIGRAIERRVAEHPEQWLILHAAWCEDGAGARSDATGADR